MSVSVCLSVRLSVTEVHWRIIANSDPTLRRIAAVLLAVLLAGGSSRAMLASARSLVLFIPIFKQLTTFSRLMAQMTCTHTRVCFLALVNIAAHLGDQIAPDPLNGLQY